MIIMLFMKISLETTDDVTYLQALTLSASVMVRASMPRHAIPFMKHVKSTSSTANMHAQLVKVQHLCTGKNFRKIVKKKTFRIFFLRIFSGKFCHIILRAEKCNNRT